MSQGPTTIPSTAPFLHQNWVAFDSEQPRLGAEEYPIFTDALVVGEIPALGPYDILNTVVIAPPGHVRQALVLRSQTFVALELGGNKGEKTAVTYYHGGAPQQEITALLSLRLGARFWAGGQSREFREDGDPLGTPRARGEHLEFALPVRSRLLPRATRQVVIDEACERQLRSVLLMKGEDAGILIRAARRYQEALWAAESDPPLAWMYLVSAIEVVAGHWSKTKSSPVDRMQQFKPELVPLLKKHGGDDLVSEVASLIADFMGATRKVVDFIVAHKPPPPPGKRSPDRVSWEDGDLRRSIRTIYQWRSRALHGGIPFPAPMCNPPSEIETGVLTERPFGLGAHVPGATWSAKDMPMLLHIFEYLIQGALLRWWDDQGGDLAQPES